MHHLMPTFFIAVFIALVTACQESASRTVAVGPDSLVRRDSAGVEIVENPGPLPKNAIEFVLGETPITEIGDDRRGSAYALNSPWATRLSNGTVVVTDQSLDLRLFDVHGNYIRTIGRRGPGPGEFASINLHDSRRDSIVVSDRSLQRFTVFAPTGDLLHTVSFDSSLRYVSPTGMLPDATVLGLQYPLRPHGRDALPPDSLIPYHIVVTRISLVTGKADSIMSVAGLPQRYALVKGDLVERNPFHLDPTIQTNGNQIFVGDRLSYEIRVYSPEGHLRRIIRRAIDGAPADGERERYEQRAFKKPEPGPDSRLLEEYNRMRKAALDYPERLPPFGKMIADGLGRLWVADYRPPLMPRGVHYRYTVFGADGAIVGTATVPDTVNLVDIGGTYMILRVAVNDAQYLRVLPILEHR